MARSARIYVVVIPNYDGDDIQAAFTVKHECKTFLERNPSHQARSVLRLPDGGRAGGEVLLTEEEFMK
jgi:hypothetical protein